MTQNSLDPSSSVAWGEFTISSPSSANHSAPKQNWVLDPVQDLILIIAAPLLCLGLAIWAMSFYGPGQGASLIITAHIVLTVAHHLPTFIRIYGDVELFRRFKWNFILGPVVPLIFAIAVLAYINFHQYPVEYFLYLYIFLALWDPWHFLRQHFGFMRIYDRHNKAPVALASNMDWAICVVWFVHIMAASADWIPGLLEDLYRNAHIPLLLVLPEGILPLLKTFTWWLAMAATSVYALYIFWCFKRGYYISLAKLALLVCTFGVMFFTYTPNDWILELVPAWGFKVGFATLGIVHMTQYLAIVWRYDRRIAQQGRVRSQWFRIFHSQRKPVAVALAAGLYVLVCLGYGDLITSNHDNRWLMSGLLAIGFTSTLMHYYFDGFIWRVRHQQNREALGLSAASAPETELAKDFSAGMDLAFTPSQQLTFSTLLKLQNPAVSWWHKAAKTGPAVMLLRQLFYFGLPMAVLTWGAVAVWRDGNTSYVAYMYQAQTLSQQGQADAAAQTARQAYARMLAELPFAEKMLDLKPSAANQAQLAFLVYNQSLYQYRILPALAGEATGLAQQQQHKAQIRRAEELMTEALASGAELGHPGREALSVEEAERILISWRRQL